MLQFAEGAGDGEFFADHGAGVVGGVAAGSADRFEVFAAEVEPGGGDRVVDILEEMDGEGDVGFHGAPF